MQLSKILSTVLIGGLLTMTGQSTIADAATTQAHEINFYGARNLCEVKPVKSFNKNPFGLVYEGAITENVAGLYAQRLAETGYITIVADASFQDASGGQPRNLDNHAFRVEDIHGMADIIASFAGVDANPFAKMVL